MRGRSRRSQVEGEMKGLLCSTTARTAIKTLPGYHDRDGKGHGMVRVSASASASASAMVVDMVKNDNDAEMGKMWVRICI